MKQFDRKIILEDGSEYCGYAYDYENGTKENFPWRCVKL